MPRKRNRILGWFNQSRNPSPAPTVQQTSSNVGPTFSPDLAQEGTTAAPSSAHRHQLSQTGSSGVPQVQSRNLLTPSTGSSVTEVAGVAWEGVKTALVILKQCSDWFPPLKAATGCFLALIDATELTSSNAADLELLRQKIDCLTPIIKENSRDRSFPWLLRRLSEFAEKLNEIVYNINKKSDHGRLRRFAEGEKDKKDITAFAEAISDLISKLQSELTLYTSRGINQLLSDESLKKLKESEAGSYDALITAKLVQRRGCTPNTRQKILEDLMEWATDPHKSRLYWMNGMAGTGKTTIAYSFCEQLQERGLLGANFFCSCSLAECSDIRYIIPTTARQLARSCPEFASALVEVLGANPQLPSLGNQLKRLLSEPFRRILEPVTDTLVVVIDALDECSNGSSEIRLFLEQLCNYFSTNTIPLKVFLTSRPEDAISRTITPSKPSSASEWSVVHIHDIEGSLVQADIKVYVEDELTEIAKTRSLEGGWPPGTEVDVVVGNANRLFIYAATVIRYVKEDCGNPRRRLSELATTSRVGQGTSERSNLSTQLIDELYRTILERALREKNAEEKLVAQMALKVIVCAQMPLTLAGIVDLLNASEDVKFEILVSDVRTALGLLPSVISTPMNEDGVATTFHASFPDFLFDEGRCSSVNHIPFRESHVDLARMCLRFMDKSLIVDNISGSDRWQTVDAIAKEKKIGSYVSSALGYACMFWGSHIETNDIDCLSTELEHFLTHQVLRWLEVLSLLRRLDIGVEVLQRMKECKHPTLSSTFDDAYKFLKDVFDIISVWPCEVFHSGLVWAPEQSFIGKTYLKTLPSRIVCGHRSGWGACELTIRGHSDMVNSVAISPDNHLVVSGSEDETVRIWNALTGEEEHVLRGHSSSVHSVAFSPNNHHIVSGSSDQTVRVWNASTGEEEHILEVHSAMVYSVAVSSDNHIVSGHSDNTVRIWNALTGEGENILLGHSNSVNSVAVSLDNRQIVSGSEDKTVRIWNASTGEEEHVLQGHSGSVVSVAVTPDNRHVVSGSDDKTVRIWNASTGEEEYVLRGHSSSVHSVAVSPNNHHVVSGSLDETVRIWNASTGEEEHVLRGHSGTVSSVAVSADSLHVVSGSQDETVRIWNASTSEGEHVLRGHSRVVISFALSPDNCHIASGSYDETVRIWNALTGEEEHVLRGHSNMVVSVAFSPDNRHVVSGSWDETVRIWNASTGEEEHVLQAHSGSVYSVAVSPDNRHVVSGVRNATVQIWNLLTGEEERVLQGHYGPVYSVAFSPDNRHIVSGSYDKTVRIWNASTGEEERVLQGHSAIVYSVAVSPDNFHIVSGSLDHTIRIWNMSRSDEEPPLVLSFVFSSDSCCIMSGPQVNTVPIRRIFLSSMVTSMALLIQGDNTTSIPIIQRLVSGEKLDLGVLFGVLCSGLSPVPIMLTPDRSSILLSNGERCLRIPSSLRHISCTAFSGSKVYFGYDTGHITILDISS